MEARYICGRELHPDHDTICTFRRENREAFQELFVKILLASEAGELKKVGRISVDGTKRLVIKEQRRTSGRWNWKPKELTKKADQADNRP